MRLGHGQLAGSIVGTRVEFVSLDEVWFWCWIYLYDAYHFAIDLFKSDMNEHCEFWTDFIGQHAGKSQLKLI